MFEIVTVSTGAKSLRCLERGEIFHPKIGPAEEARILHVEQHDLAARAATQERFVLWDVGLGAAANAIAGIIALKGSAAELHSFDRSKAPLEFALKNATCFPYLTPYVKNLEELLRKHRTQINSLDWHLHAGDFRARMREGVPFPHGVFYDPYSPKTNPEMWTLEHFTQLREQLGPNCLLTNYSRSTAVRVTLLLAGFYVGIGCVVGEKAETTVFSTQPALLKRPLTREWLERVRVSRNAAPLRGPLYSEGPIGPDDFAKLNSLPQFD